jgi:hypothetical protein
MESIGQMIKEEFCASNSTPSSEGAAEGGVF